MCEGLAFTFRTYPAVKIHLLPSETEGQLPWRVLCHGRKAYVEGLRVLVCTGSVLCAEQGQMDHRARAATTTPWEKYGGDVGGGGVGGGEGVVYEDERARTATTITWANDAGGGGQGCGGRVRNCFRVPSFV